MNCALWLSFSKAFRGVALGPQMSAIGFRIATEGTKMGREGSSIDGQSIAIIGSYWQLISTLGNH
jgi:hypothetical protein